MAEPTEQMVEESTAQEKTEFSKNDSKYRKIILAAQRSKQLQRGATPRVDMDPRKSKSTRIAMQELEEDKIKYEVTPVAGVNESQ